MNSGTFVTRTDLRQSFGLVILRLFVQMTAGQKPALTTRLAVLAVGALALAPFAGAHHSRIEFVDEIRELEGELLEIVWLNPHPALFVEVLSEDGTTETWRVEAHTGVRVYDRMGVTPDLFTVGDTIRVAGRVSTRRDRHLLGLNVLLPNDTVVRLSRDDPPYWAARTVIGTDGAVPFDEAALRDAASEDRGLFRVWSVGPTGRSQNLSYTQAADAGVQPPSHLGYSVGRREGSTLIVETTKIDYPWVDNEARTPQSPDVRTTERFTLSEDQSRLDYELIITDPVTFTEPATRTRTYLALDEPFDVLDCNVF